MYLNSILFLHIGILQDLLRKLHGLPGEVHVEFFEFSAGKGFGEIVAVFEALNLKLRTLLAGQGAISPSRLHA
jgi:hypothetical protein